VLIFLLDAVITKALFLIGM